MKKIALLLLLSSLVFAKGLTFSKEVYSALNSANKQIDAKQYKSAIATLKSAKTDKKEEIAYINSILAQAYLKMNDLKNASRYLQSAVNSKTLPKELEKESLYNLLQIYLINQNHQKAIETFKVYKLHVKTIDPTIRANIASSYLKLKRYNESLKQIKIALNQKPKNANFMQILLAIYYEKKDYKNLCSTLESAYRLKILNSSYTKQIAYCLYENRAPLRGAKFLDDAIKNKKVKNTSEIQKLLFNFYFDAKEYDKAHDIAKKIQNTKLALIMIQAYFDKGEYKKTISSINEFEKHFNKKTKASTTLLKAQSYYYLHQKKKALEEFKKALKNPSTNSISKEWIEFISY